jgi:MerR family transcriptional regulator, heat shock protein HspR
MPIRTQKKRGRAGYMISAVSELYNLHPQTLRLYERVGLLKPSRSEGNTRLYTDADLERLEVILTLTREMGVNLAGIEIILNMREKISEMQRQMKAFAEFVQKELSHGLHSPHQKPSRDAMVHIPPSRVIRVHK